MKNRSNDPFAGLDQKPPERDHEIMRGSFACQRNTCMHVMHEAKLFSDSGALEWECPDGHHSKIEDFPI